MIKRLYSLIVFVFISFELFAQILPKEGSALNYRLIGFSNEGVKSGSFKIEIAKGDYFSFADFNNNIIKTVSLKKNKSIIEVPFFGCKYTWRVITTDSESKLGQLHHFSTGFCDAVDSAKMRLTLLKPGTKYNDAFVFLDGNRALYDMNGNPVWYLPDTGSFDGAPLDMKLAPKGTITFLLKNNAYEINYNGKILWKAPNDGKVSGARTEFYSHQFSKFENGNYMIISIMPVYMPVEWPDMNGKEFVFGDKAMGVDKLGGYHRTMVGTIIEYDKSGKVVWSWNSLKYFNESDVRNKIMRKESHDFDMHENSFYFDNKNKAVYISFKTCSRILKIAYPGGNVEDFYGEQFEPGGEDRKNGLFYGQHAINRTNDGYLYLFNNNRRDTTLLPEVLMFQEPFSKNDTLKTIWKYSCNLEGIKGSQSKEDFSTGGNVEELPDGSFFVTMSEPHSKMFIVNREKEILWSAIPEIWSSNERLWKSNPQYRASIVVNRKDFEQLVWSGEK